MTPLAYSYHFPRYYRDIPFNKEIIKLVQKWEKYHHIKFTGKILSTKGPYGYFNYKNIYIPTCDKHTLFHELQHVLQQRRGLNVKQYTQNYQDYLYPRYNNMDLYFKLPTERDANKQAKILNSVVK